PGRPLGMEAAIENLFARAIRRHDADRERPGVAPALLGEGDIVALGTPGRRVVGAVAEADALRLAPRGRHDIELARAAAIGLEDDIGAVRRVGRRGVDRGAAGELLRLAAAEWQREDIGRAATLNREDERAPVRREARREGHGADLAERLRAAARQVEDVDLR